MGGGKGDGKGKGDHEEVCVEEMKACAADKTCSMLHEKLQAAMKKDGGYGGKGGDGKYDDKKGGYGDKKDDKKGEYDGKKEGDGKKPPMKKEDKDDHDDDDHDKKKEYKEGYDGEKKDLHKKPMDKKEGGKKGDRRQLAGHEHHDDDDKKDMEPSAELKAAMKACTENELCKKLMECKKKHKESGGKGDGKGKGDHEEVCVEEMKACAADKTCS